MKQVGIFHRETSIGQTIGGNPKQAVVVKRISNRFWTSTSKYNVTGVWIRHLLRSDTSVGLDICAVPTRAVFAKRVFNCRRDVFFRRSCVQMLNSKSCR